MDNALLGLREAKTDAYLMTNYKAKKLRTRVKIFKEQDIEWNQELWIPAQYPIIQGRIVVKLMDEDEAFDETIGSLLFDAQDIIDGKNTNVFMWKNVYGSPMNMPNS